MDVRVRGDGAVEPFLAARDLLATEYDLELPVVVEIREDPDERTMAGHYDDRHELLVSRRAATSAMARELALHEFAHMARYEEGHPSHVQSTEEALFLALAGRSVERRKLSQCYQIANHMKDIYADDITLALGPTDKLVAFFESSLASALSDRPDESGDGTAWGLFGGRAPDAAPDSDSRRLTAATDPEITAVNAAFALAMVERHGLADADHRLYDLAHAAARDAPAIDSEAFKRRFKNLQRNPDPSDYRKELVDATRAFAAGSGRAAD